MCDKPTHRTRITVSVGSREAKAIIPLNSSSARPTAETIWKLILVDLGLPKVGSLRVILEPFCENCGGAAGFSTVESIDLGGIPERSLGRVLEAFCVKVTRDYLRAVRDGQVILHALDDALEEERRTLRPRRSDPRLN